VPNTGAAQLTRADEAACSRLAPGALAGLSKGGGAGFWLGPGASVDRMRKRKSWREKPAYRKGLPGVKEIPQKLAARWEARSFVVPASLVVDTHRERVPSGKLMLSPDRFFHPNYLQPHKLRFQFIQP
jgi:hypothetical protein